MNEVKGKAANVPAVVVRGLALRLDGQVHGSLDRLGSLAQHEGAAVRRGREVVHVHHLQRRPAEQPQAAVAGAALVQVEDVGQHAGFRVAAVDGHQSTFAQPAQRPREAPQLHLRNDADLLAGVHEGAVALRGPRQGEVGLVGRAHGRGRQPPAADLLDHVHRPPGVLQPLPATGLVVHGLFTGRLTMVLTWLIAFVIQGQVRSWYFGTSWIVPLTPMTSAAFMVFTLYMIPDPATTPVKPLRQVLFGITIAAVYGLLIATHIVYCLFLALAIVCGLRGLSLHAAAALRALRSNREGSLAHGLPDQRVQPAAT